MKSKALLLLSSMILPGCAVSSVLINKQENAVSHGIFGIDLNEVWKKLPKTFETSHVLDSPLEMFNESTSSGNFSPSFFGINIESFFEDNMALMQLVKSLKQSFKITSITDQGLLGLLSLKVPILGTELSHPIMIGGFKSIKRIWSLTTNAISQKNYVSTIKDKRPDQIVTQKKLTWGDLGVSNQLPFTSDTQSKLSRTAIDEQFLTSFKTKNNSIKQMFLKCKNITTSENTIVANMFMSFPVFSSKWGKLVPQSEMNSEVQGELFGNLEFTKHSFPITIHFDK